MKKWTPIIIIYCLDARDRNTGEIIEDHFFLFYKRAKRFWDAHYTEFENRNYEVSLCGVQLWLL